MSLTFDNSAPGGRITITPTSEAEMRMLALLSGHPHIETDVKLGYSYGKVDSIAVVLIPKDED